MMLAMRSKSVGPLLLVLAVGCGDDVSSSADEGGSSGAETMMSTGGTDDATSTTAGPGTTASDSTGDAEDSSSESGFEPPVPECGNGFVESDEECDDANDDDEDGCTSQCQRQCGIEWVAAALPPTDTSDLLPRGVVADAGGGATVAGYLREITTDQRGNETILDEEGIVLRTDGDGEVLWEVRLAEAGTDVDVAGVATDDDGNVYVVASVDIPGEDSDIRLYKLASDGSEIWSVDHDSAVDSAEDFAFGVAIGADGHPVVSGQVRVGEGDDDVWVASFDADTGGNLWMAQWTGSFSGSFSTDDGGPLAIGADGTVYVLAREYIDFETSVVTLLGFDPATGDATELFTPEVGVGGEDHRPTGVAVDEGGAVVLSYTRVLPASEEYNVLRVEGGTATAIADATTFADASPLRDASEFTVESAAPLAGGGLVLTGQLLREGKGASWAETWVARLDAQDALDCMFVRESPQLSLVPGSLRGSAISANGDGRAFVAAQEFEDGVQSLWLGAFRPD